MLSYFSVKRLICSSVAAGHECVSLCFSSIFRQIAFYSSFVQLVVVVVVPFPHDRSAVTFLNRERLFESTIHLGRRWINNAMFLLLVTTVFAFSWNENSDIRWQQVRLLFNRQE